MGRKSMKQFLVNRAASEIWVFVRSLKTSGTDTESVTDPTNFTGTTPFYTPGWGQTGKLFLREKHFFLFPSS